MSPPLLRIREFFFFSVLDFLGMVAKRLSSPGARVTDGMFFWIIPRFVGSLFLVMNF